MQGMHNKNGLKPLTNCSIDSGFCLKRFSFLKRLSHDTKWIKGEQTKQKGDFTWT